MMNPAQLARGASTLPRQIYFQGITGTHARSSRPR